MEYKTPLTSPDEATPGWLTGVLHEHGCLARGRVERVGLVTERSVNASNARLRLTYSEDAAGHGPPQSLFLKLCDLSESPFGDTEVRYYTVHTAGLSPSSAPACFHTAHSASASVGRYHLLLEDLSETHAPGWDAEPNLGRASLAVEALARLHARWWDAEDLPDAAERMPDQAVIGRYVAAARAGLEPLFETMGEVLSAAQRDLIRRVFDRHEARMLQRAEGSGLTIIHADPNPGNILSPRNPDAGGGDRAYVIDRQLFDWSLAAWLGISDVAYMMVHWWPAEVRRALERPLIERYVRALESLGVAGYSVERAWADYRLCAIQSLYVVGAWCADPREREEFAWVWKPQLAKTLTALEDLHCMDLLG
jgi:hypothetical protein